MLLYQSLSTTQLAIELNNENEYRPKLNEVRSELVRLHHLGVVRRVAICEDERPFGPPARLYFRNYIWETTEHGREHSALVAGCRHCERRERFLIRFGPHSEQIG